MKFLKKFDYNAPVVLTFSLVCLIVYGINVLTDGASNRLLFCTYFTSWADPLMYVRLFGHVLGHASWDHFLGNITYILLIGPMLESRYGHKTLLEMIVITALVTGLVNNLFFSTGLLGASGIVFMMIVLASISEVRDNRIPLTFILCCVIWIGGQIIASMSQDNISQLTHIVGGLLGGFYGWFLRNEKSGSR